MGSIEPRSKNENACVCIYSTYVQFESSFFNNFLERNIQLFT